ncbi:DUF2127 domain-containing protein [Amycolatopsis sp. K13G38]|uniref:DUF2127 domain-containing protein n=1 Tax=Amycolatopsis acididurans TaxID=2724524 RepID=A0ABX1J3R1_9PSEU|nr:DUF2127 domain-containing protein [Amycolatopsis acididurans]NKQ54423.1 DUF2127 domain-containing protein [Amycolatopsis acididurans]
MADEKDPRAPVGTGKRAGLLHYELLGCARRGHVLVGRDAAQIRPEDAMVVREQDGLRWHRCLRCDAWLPLPPGEPRREFCPGPDEVDVPLRGRLLRDRYVLRLIALDRALHFLVLAVLAIGIFAFARERATLSGPFFRIVDAIQGGVGGRTGSSGQGMLGELTKAFNARGTTLSLIGLVIAAYALLEGVEAVGLWLGRRWAEYLTFIATTVLLIPELYELTHRVSALKIVTLIVNLLVVAYLLFAKRLFGLRGGARAEAQERARDVGWPALEHVLPGPVQRT